MKADKRFGQHFLEPAWAAKLIDAVAPQPSDTFLEIGPGRGALTRPLARSGARIIAVEVDRRLAAELASSAPPNLHVVNADFLEVDIAPLIGVPDSSKGAHEGRPYAAGGVNEDGETAGAVRVVGNLPYNVSSPILFRLLALYDRLRLFSDATLMLQREVADRLVAARGTKEYGVLTLQVALRATVSPLLKLPPGAFRPVPQVSSTVVRLVFHPPFPPVDVPAFETLVRGVFQHRRKTLANCLRSVWPPGARLTIQEALEKAALDGTRRPETLDLSEMARLAGIFSGARLE